MNHQSNTVSVKEIPETFNMKQRRIFMRELEVCLNVGRPCIVIDCSKVKNVDHSVLFLLLCCLEEAMKRRGDVRLATIPQECHSLMQVTGVSRLFKIFDEVADAVNSYNRGRVLVLETQRVAVEHRTANAA